MTNPFTGRLGLEIAKALFWRGADVHLILGGNAVTPPSYIETSRVQNFDDYRRQVCGLLDREPFDWGVFSAAVADYAPRSAFAGKLPSGQRDLNIELEPTAKVIDLVREAHPSLKMISFKYQENMSHADLIGVARERLRKGHQAVIANRGEELTAGGEQVAHLVTDDAVARLETKPGIAEGLCRFIERGSVRTDS
jgi:phosphopantothenoylcysteine decarboxylase/phosphopantothenate--cysteine ligase